MEITLKTNKPETLQSFLADFQMPLAESHKGENGKALIIGGSQLFHASVLWSAEIASHFVDLLHFASTNENNELLMKMKVIFRNGIVIPQREIPGYIEEDESILIGPGMVRTKLDKQNQPVIPFEEIFELKDEGKITYHITRHILQRYPDKRFVLDAGALQMMDPDWLTQLNCKPILTPHQLEFKRLFGVAVKSLPFHKKVAVVKQHAKEYNAIIVLKAVKDIITDGEKTYIVEGGNQGLTKGGTGDILAGLATALFTKHDALFSAVLASYLLKRSADELADEMGYWFNITNLIDKIPATLKQLV